MLPTTLALKLAARWLARQDWKQSPAYWVSQAQTRYQLTDQEASFILMNMRIQLGQN
jgi:uncharacterized protein YqjF (DUF2071 family)